MKIRSVSKLCRCLPAFLMLLIMAPSMVFALDVSGIIDADSQWSVEDSPVSIIGDFRVSAGVTLTIDPGTVIEVQPLADALDPRGLAIVPEGVESPRQAEELYNDALAALGRGDVAAAQNGYALLQQLYDRLVQEYQLRIVSREGMRSGIWRVPQNNPNARNYYVIVEAVTADGKRLELPVTSEEDGKTRTVKQWGLRVKASVFEQIKRLLAGMQPAQQATAQHDGLAAFFQQLLNISRLDSRRVTESGLTPVPCPATPRPQLEVLAASDTLNRHAPPG